MKNTFLILTFMSFTAATLPAAVVYSTPLPSGNISTSYINGSGANRANFAYSPGGAVGDILGDDFIAPFTGTVDAVTLYLISNGAQGASGNSPSSEFSQLKLYYGGFDPSTFGTTLNQFGTSGSTTSYSSVLTHYYANVGYESIFTPGSFFDVYAVTFTTPGFNITSGNDYAFALGGTAIGGNVLTLAASIPSLTQASNGFPFNGDGFFVGFQNGAPPTYFTDINSSLSTPGNPIRDADINAFIVGTPGGASATPEPSTITMAAAGLAALALGAMRRRKA